MIVELGLVPRERVEQAVEAARAGGVTPESLLVQHNVLSPDGLARAIAERNGLSHIDLTVFQVDMGAANLLGSAAAKRYEAVPVKFHGENVLILAMADPANILAIDDVSLMTGYEVRPAVASREDILALISRLTRLDEVVRSASDEEEEQSGPAEVVDLRESADDAPVIKLVNGVIAQAVEMGASDVHLAPGDGELRVRFRIDGVLQESATVPKRMIAGVVSRVKIMGDLDISERRVPQDGRVGLTIDGHHVDLRVVTLPSRARRVDRHAHPGHVQRARDIEQLGMADEERQRFEHAFTQAYGAVLVTGPTGSGKSTSLYAALGQLNTPEKNIITIEDPVEHQVDGVTQVQVNARAGLTFANGLRAMMRADPDIIMVGEIRDKETAQIAVEAALTGHLVLSTLHTNDAPGADHAPDRDGRRAVPGRLRDRLRRRPAPVPHALPALQGAHDHLGRRAPGARLPVEHRPRGLRGRRLRALRRQRLQGPHRHLRGHAAHRGDPLAGHRARQRRPDRRGRDARRHAPPARRRPREGPPGPHVDRRDRPRHVHGLGGVEGRRAALRGAAGAATAH